MENSSKEDAPKMSIRQFRKYLRNMLFMIALGFMIGFVFYGSHHNTNLSVLISFVVGLGAGFFAGAAGIVYMTTSGYSMINGDLIKNGEEIPE